MGDYTNFYLGSVTVAGALAGLLFVSLSVAPQRVEGLGLARAWELLGPGTGGLITEIAEHAETVLRRDRGRPPDGSPPQQ